MPGQKIKPFLWYDTQAEEAARLYVSLFKDSSIDKIIPGPSGGAWVVEFTLAGVCCVALNGGPMFKFTEAISLTVDCETQAEIDEIWEKLCADGGAPIQCGWLKDKFGLAWQIVPSSLGRLVHDPVRGAAVMEAMMKMIKLDIKTLEAAGA